MIGEGYEWLARETANAADRVAGEFGELGANGARRRAYCEGVRDVLRVLVGDAEPTAELSRIMDRRAL